MEETETVLTLADFGALLRERRIHKGLTEENVAAELKITSRLVKAIEEGDMEPRPAWTDKPVPVEGNGINGFAGLFANREEGAMLPSDRQRGPDAARR